MIPYNTDLKKLVLPEYGRIVHDMVQICKTLEDRDERNRFAAAIVDTMKAMTQEKGKQNDDRKFWDHLYVIAENDIDIDSPFGVPDANAVNPRPGKIPYVSSDFGRRHYGKVLQKMVHEVALMPNSEEKDACVELLANHVKKLLTINNAEYANDERVYADLQAISSGSIALEEGIFDLPEYKEEKPAKNQKKKKNR
ncbi:MAG: DUF4290 domain-containing protein [Muribaculaceae bacterium]|nr:DUF4290 domain-containing protein [Muribaculaceae bacterium]